MVDLNWKRAAGGPVRVLRKNKPMFTKEYARQRRKLEKHRQQYIQRLVDSDIDGAGRALAHHDLAARVQAMCDAWPGPFDATFDVGMTIEPIPRHTGRWVIDDLYGAVVTKRGRRR